MTVPHALRGVPVEVVHDGNLDPEDAFDEAAFAEFTKHQASNHTMSIRTNAALADQFRAARRASVPLVAITTPDPADTIRTISRAMKDSVPRVTWDIASGLRGLNEQGRKAIATMLNGGNSLANTEGYDVTVGKPMELFIRAALMERDGVLFVHMANRWLDDPGAMQAAWNLRDKYKEGGQTLVLLAPAITLSAELAGDVMVFDEPLPDREALADIVRDAYADAQEAYSLPDLDKDLTERAVDAVQGLPAFQVEQVTAVSLSPKGIDLPGLWERKRLQVEQTPGLKMHRGTESFDDIGGLGEIKDFLSCIMRGNGKPGVVVFLDEIEKAMPGANDTSGVAQDQLGTILSDMQDRNAAGVILVGPPGAGKSMVAKAAGNAAGIPTVQLDLGAAKGSLVGQSEHQLRAALKVINSVGNGRALWIATSNNISQLPPELRRRYTLGTYFFDLPDTEERASIWPVFLRQFGLPADSKLPAQADAQQWTGAEIRACCFIAWSTGWDLERAAGRVVPVSVSAQEQIARLRKSAEQRYLSASYPGLYKAPVATSDGNEAQRTRRLRVDED